MTKGRKPVPQMETRERILQAAVQVFVMRGFESATLKEITDRAGANIAAVNYYFRTKDELIRQVLGNLLGTVNRARDVALTSYERSVADGRDPGLGVLLDALIRPMAEAGGNTPEGRAHVSLLMQARSSPAAPHDLQDEDGYRLHERFIAALERILTHLSRKEIIWRYDCARGSTIFILADLAPNIQRIVRVAGSPNEADTETVVRELVAFIASGLMAPSARTILGRDAPWQEDDGVQAYAQ